MATDHPPFLVIGGGAAGFFCAVNLARLRPDVPVIIAEKTSKVLAKVRISGGGRCNLAHACYDPVEMSQHYPRGSHFVRKAFHQFFTPDTLRWFESRGVGVKAEADGRIFPASDSSQTVIDCLMREFNRYSVQQLLNREVTALERTAAGWQARFANGGELTAAAVCVACGGYPKEGQFDWLKALGHHIEPPVPSLFTFNIPESPLHALMGLAAPVARIRISGSKLEASGPVLITHWGLSGPAVLRLSAWGARELNERQYHFEVQLNWIADWTATRLSEQLQALRQQSGSRRLGSGNFTGLPQRLWEFLLQQAAIDPQTRWADLSRAGWQALVNCLQAMKLQVRGKTGFKEEFVTAGGIRLSEVDPASMQSRKAPGLFFAGETLDVDGITGGFNFQHAWTSGFIAATHMAALPEPLE